MVCSAFTGYMYIHLKAYCHLKFMIDSIDWYFAYLSTLSFSLRNRNFFVRKAGFDADFRICSKCHETFDYRFHQIVPNLAGNVF
jgi:hypothetical protein